MTAPDERREITRGAGGVIAIVYRSSLILYLQGGSASPMIGHVHSRQRLGSPGRWHFAPPLASLLGLIVVLTVSPVAWMAVSSLTTKFELLPGIMPMFLILFLLRRQLVSGLTAGAVE